MDFVDYYKILGVAEKATPKEIKNAYRKLARKYHPDLHPNDKDAKHNFQQINEANEVLSDPDKRIKYDQYGKDWQHGAEAQQSHPYQNQSSGSDFSDFFASMFGGNPNSGRSRQMKFKGEEYQTEIRLNLVDAYETHKQTLNVNGQKIRITIPAGIENGQTIRIKGHGGSGINGGPNGDLFITFSIADDSEFERIGNNLFTDVDLNLYTAILGGEITIETLKGQVKLKVKPETQNGSKIKLKGKGFPLYRREGVFGDLQVTYHIKIPTNLSEKQIQLFRELFDLQTITK